MLYFDDVPVYSGQWTDYSPTPLAGKFRYFWDIAELELGWEDKTTVRVRLVPLANVCGRTPVVLEAILDTTITTGDRCGAVSALELAEVTELDFTGHDVYTLKNGDFAGLSGLERLDLSGQPLFYRIFQVGDKYGVAHNVFAPLSNLRELDLSDTDLWSLPGGMFDGLTSLETLRVVNTGYPDFPAIHRGL